MGGPHRQCGCLALGQRAWHHTCSQVVTPWAQGWAPRGPLWSHCPERWVQGEPGLPPPAACLSPDWLGPGRPVRGVVLPSGKGF